MSRSYKKVPYSGDHTCKKSGKKFANRRVRHYKDDLANGKAYIKLYEQWDICDYGGTCSFKHYLQSYVYNKEDNLYYYLRYDGRVLNIYTKKQLYIDWYRYYKRK